MVCSAVICGSSDDIITGSKVQHKLGELVVWIVKKMIDGADGFVASAFVEKLLLGLHDRDQLACIDSEDSNVPTVTGHESHFRLCAST